MRRAALFALASALLIAPALAQAPQGTLSPVRGTIEKLDGNTLVVKSRDGSEVSVQLAPNFSVNGLEKKSLADIKPGDFVASAGRKGADGKLHAIEVRIMPEARRGAGEGQFPWDLPDSLMTNATVTGIATAAQGETLKVTYKGQESEFIVDPDTPVMVYAPSDASHLKPGLAVFVFSFKQADGRLTAGGVTVETNGLKPPL